MLRLQFMNMKNYLFWKNRYLTKTYGSLYVDRTQICMKRVLIKNSITDSNIYTTSTKINRK